MQMIWKSLFHHVFFFLQYIIDGTKEAAFSTAMLSAAIAFNIAKACTAKDVTECSCEGVKRPFRGQPWKWKGCNVNIRFGSYAAERFMMSGRSNDTKLNMMSRHNVRAGLEVRFCFRNSRQQYPATDENIWAKVPWFKILQFNDSTSCIESITAHKFFFFKMDTCSF